VLTPEEIQIKIEQYQEHIENLVDEIREAGVKSAIAETDYEIAFAQERLTVRYEAQTQGVKTTVDIVDDNATVRTAELRKEAMLAKNNLSTLREALSATRTNLESMRTLAASNRAIV
jgi:chemotaxis regulatin CheY-phosphate phosphatase CheZ